MSKAKNGLPQTESDVLAGVLSGQSCHVVLVSSPPAYVKEISKYLEYSGKRNGRSDAPNEANSDSGDSLFLTQKPVPEPVRPKRRRSIRYTHFNHNGDLMIEDEDDTSSSSSDGDSRLDKKKKAVYRLPKFSFPFLQERRSSQKNFISSHRNKKLHHFAMGGFFKCVQEQQKCHQKRKQMASLPTIDGKEEYISPISEPEEERTEAEDIRVVARKRFVVSLKAKSFQPWCKATETCSEDKQHTEGIQNSGSESQRQMMEEASVRRLLSSCAKSCDEGDSSHGGREAVDVSSFQAETAHRSLKRAKKKLSFVQDRNANQFCDDSDAAACETDSDKRKGENTEAFTEGQSADAECEPEGPDLLQQDTADHTLCESTKKKKRNLRNKYKGVEEVNDLSLDKAEGQKAAEFVKVATEEEQGCLSHGKSDAADLKQNRQKVKCADHKIGPEVNVERSKKKKKKKKRIDEQMEQFQSSAEPQTDNEEPEKQTLDGASDQTAAGPSQDLLREDIQGPLESSGKRKKHKKKKRQSTFNDTPVEDSCKDLDFSKDLASAESVGLSAKKETRHDSCSPERQTITEQVVTKKRKKREKLSDDTNAQCEPAGKREEKRASCFLHADQQEQVGPDDSTEQPAGRTSDVTAQSAEIPASLEGHGAGRKKKKKRSAVQPSVNRDSEEPQETCQSSPSVVMKKKRKLTESSESAADAEPSQTQESQVPGEKKKRKRRRKKGGSSVSTLGNTSMNL